METKPNTTQEKPGKTKIFLSHPITGFSVGIVGIALAIYFYWAGIKEPKLIFLIHPVRTPIVQAGRLSELSVSLRGKPINNDLTAAQFVIWNSGKAPVRHDDILKPIVLMTVSNCPIYEATIRNVSRDVVGFQLITNGMASGYLGLDWKILEHNDGASIQILYGGDQKMNFLEAGGVVIGQSHVPFQVLNVETKNLSGTVQIIFFDFILLFFALISTVYIVSGIKNLVKSIQNRKIGLVLIHTLKICGCGLIAVVLYFVVYGSFFVKNAPPFDF